MRVYFRLRSGSPGARRKEIGSPKTRILTTFRFEPGSYPAVFLPLRVAPRAPLA